MLLKTDWYWHKDRYSVLWNRVEDPDIIPHTYTHLIFNKVRNTHWRKENFQQVVLVKLDGKLEKKANRAMSITLNKTECCFQNLTDLLGS